MVVDLIYKARDGAARRSLVVVWSAEAGGAIVAVVLSAVGLAGILRMRVAAIAAISLGAVLVCESAGSAWCFTKLGWRTMKEGQFLEWGGAIAGKLLGGLGGMVVGIAASISGSCPAASGRAHFRGCLLLPA